MDIFVSIELLIMLSSGHQQSKSLLFDRMTHTYRGVLKVQHGQGKLLDVDLQTQCKLRVLSGDTLLHRIEIPYLQR